jgi:hypothetical protein
VDGRAGGQSLPEQSYTDEGSIHRNYQMVPFACNMAVIPAESRAAHSRLIRRLMTEAVEDIRELPDGLAFTFPAEEYDAVTEFVGLARDFLSRVHANDKS